MRFDKMTRYEPLNWTARKRALAASRPERDLAKARAALPLLADQLEAAAPVDLDAAARRRQALLDGAEARMRSLTAAQWRSTRAAYFAATEAQRAAIRAAWAVWRGPLKPLYLRHLVEHETGVTQARSRAFRAREAALRAEALAQLARQASLAFGVRS
jgi:hypothetical protein